MFQVYARQRKWKDFLVFNVGPKYGFHRKSNKNNINEGTYDLDGVRLQLIWNNWPTETLYRTVQNVFKSKDEKLNFVIDFGKNFEKLKLNPGAQKRHEDTIQGLKIDTKIPHVQKQTEENGAFLLWEKKVIAERESAAAEKAARELAAAKKAAAQKAAEETNNEDINRILDQQKAISEIQTTLEAENVLTFSSSNSITQNPAEPAEEAQLSQDRAQNSHME
jgi:hypothetical protein